MKPGPVFVRKLRGADAPYLREVRAGDRVAFSPCLHECRGRCCLGPAAPRCRRCERECPCARLLRELLR